MIFHVINHRAKIKFFADIQINVQLCENIEMNKKIDENKFCCIKTNDCFSISMKLKVLIQAKYDFLTFSTLNKNFSKMVFLFCKNLILFTYFLNIIAKLFNLFKFVKKFKIVIVFDFFSLIDKFKKLTR